MPLGLDNWLMLGPGLINTLFDVLVFPTLGPDPNAVPAAVVVTGVPDLDLIDGRLPPTIPTMFCSFYPNIKPA